MRDEQRELDYRAVDDGDERLGRPTWARSRELRGS